MTTFTGALRRATVLALSLALVATMTVTGAIPTPEVSAVGDSLTGTVTLNAPGSPQIATVTMTPAFWMRGDEVTVTVTPTAAATECAGSGEGLTVEASMVSVRGPGNATYTSPSPSDGMDDELQVSFWDKMDFSILPGVIWQSLDTEVPLSGDYSVTFKAGGYLAPEISVQAKAVASSSADCNFATSNEVVWDYPELNPAYDLYVDQGTRSVTLTDRTSLPSGESDETKQISWEISAEGEYVASGTGTEFTRIVPKEGEYTLKHKVIDRFLRAVEKVTTFRVGEDPMRGALFERPGSTTGNVIKEGETLPLRLRVENHDTPDETADPPQDGWFSDLRVESAEVIELDEFGEPVPGGDGGDAGTLPAAQPLAELTADTRKLPGELAPRAGGTEADWGMAFADYTLTAHRAGSGRAEVKVSAMRSNGEAISKTFTFGVTIEPSPLTVTITQEPGVLVYGQDNNNDEAITDEDNEFDIKVTVTNTSDVTVTGVKSMEPNAATALSFTGKIGESSAAVALTLVSDEGTSFGDIEPDASKTLTYRYRAIDRVLADAKYVVSGTQDGVEVTAHGIKEIKVSKDLWLEAEFGKTEPERVYRSGQTARLKGTIKNVTKVLGPNKTVVEEGFDVGVVIEPTLEGNAGGGQLFKAGSGEQTPLTPTPFTLAPDDEVEIAAVLGTIETDQPSTAGVTYQIHVYKLEDPEDPIEGDETNYAIAADSQTQTFTLTSVPTRYDEWLRCPEELNIVSYVSCRFTLGVKAFSVGLWNLGAITTHGLGQYARAHWGVISTYVWAMQQIVEYLDGNDDALTRLANEILIDLQALKAVGVQVVKALPSVAEIKAWAVVTVNGLADKIHKNSLRAWMGELAELAGANLDSSATLASLVTQRVALKVMAGAAGREGAERTALETISTEQAESLARRVADAEASALTRSGVLQAGDDVTGMTKVLEAFGVSSGDVANMMRIAREEGVNLLFRARSSKAMELIKNNLAWAKPSGVSIKTVSEIDVNYLGYLSEWEGRAVLVEPPVKWAPAGAQRNSAIEQYLDGFHQLNTTSAAGRDLRAAVKARIEQRMDEWPVQLQKFSSYAERGIDASFYAEKQGLKRGLIANETKLRKAKVTVDTLTGAGSDTRRVFHLQMADATGTDFRWITGDIDFLAILNPDGSIIADVVKRTRIYESMRSLLGMQHGESMTFSGSETLRQKFLDCCTADNSTMLAATFDGRVVATYFDDALAVMPDGLNAAMLPTEVVDRIDSLVYLTGVTSEMVSAARAGANVSLPSFKDFAVNFIADKTKPVPTDLKGVMEALAKLEQKVNPSKPEKPVTFDRAGKPIAASGKAGDTGTEFVPVIYTVNEKTGQFDRFRAPGRAFAQGAAGPSYLAGFFLADVPEPPGGLATVETFTGDWAELVEAGYPQPDVGSWRELAEEDLNDDGDAPGVAPFTLLGSDVAPGATALDVLTADDLGVTTGSPFFRPGDRVVIDPATEGEEFAIVRSYSAASGALALVSPLKNQHHLAAQVLFLAEGTVPSGSSSGSAAGSGPVAPSVTTTVPAGGTASSAPNARPTAATPIVAQVVSPVAGQVSFATGGTPTAQQGYSMLGQSIVVTAPPATAAKPLRLTFHVAAAVVPEGTAADELSVFRNGEPVARCVDPNAVAATPNPCVASVTVTDGVVSVQVRSSHASVWTVGAPAVELAGQRIAGANRYETSARIAERFGHANAVILANGSTAKAGVDALAANVLAGRVRAPILLTDSASVTPEVLAAVRTVLSQSVSATIYVMGGVDSVSPEVAARVKAAAAAGGSGTVSVGRIAGANRYETAAAAASFGNAAPGLVRLRAGDSARRTAILASGVVNADALAAGALSYAWGVPVLLTGPGDLSDAALGVIRDQKITQLLVLGGVDRVSGAAVAAARAAGVTSVERIAGVDRYATAAQLYRMVTERALGPGGRHYGAGAAYLANGYTGFPDALSVGPLAGREEAAVLTVGPMLLPSSTADYLARHGGAIGALTSLGRSPTVSAGVLAAANAAAGRR